MVRRDMILIVARYMNAAFRVTPEATSQTAIAAIPRTMPREHYSK